MDKRKHAWTDMKCAWIFTQDYAFPNEAWDLLTAPRPDRIGVILENGASDVDESNNFGPIIYIYDGGADNFEETVEALDQIAPEIAGAFREIRAAGYEYIRISE
jgi:hypothetical protein